MPTISFCTHGCKVNQYETEQAAASAREQGYDVVEWGEQADIQIVHTCSITSAAVRDGRQALRQALRRNPSGEVIATGCAARTDLASLIPSPRVQVVEDLAQAVMLDSEGAALSGEDSACASCPSQAQLRTRALLKIHDGCYFRCSFCIVPSARPIETSKPVDEAVREAEAYVALGHREIVLTGVRITGYRPEGHGRSGLVELIRRLGDIPGLSRVRLTTLYPSEVRDDLLEAMALSPNMCHHLHLALQSGDDAVLKRMNRHYDSGLFEDVVSRARSLMPGVAISSDVIAGFPGETEEAFQNTAALMRRVGFSRAHVFTYSPRPGTPGAEMDQAVPVAVAKARTRELIEIAAQTGRAFREKMIGSTESVLVEQRRSDGALTGLTRSYIEVSLPGPDRLRGHEVDVRVEGLTQAGVAGSVVTANEGEGSDSEEAWKTAFSAR